MLYYFCRCQHPVKKKPTYSTKKVVISNSISVGQTSLTLSSPDIPLNEHYKAIVRVGSTFLHHFEIDRHVLYGSVTVMHDDFTK